MIAEMDLCRIISQVSFRIDSLVEMLVSKNIEVSEEMVNYIVESIDEEHLHDRMLIEYQLIVEKIIEGVLKQEHFK